MIELPDSQHVWHRGYDGNCKGVYFITICVRGRHELLGQIIMRGDHTEKSTRFFTANMQRLLGHDDPETPLVVPSLYGLIAEKHIKSIADDYYGVHVDDYVIMSNHIHILLTITNRATLQRSSNPSDAFIPRIIKAFKKHANMEYGFEMWRVGYHEQKVGSEQEYLELLEFIDSNPLNWRDDEYFVNGA